MIIGHARHGKDTVAEVFAEFGFIYRSSSQAALDIFLFDRLVNHYGLKYNSKEEAFADRVNHRATWYNEITAYNTPDKTRLAREIMKSNDIYVGMRSHKEIIECRLIGVFDLIIAVDAFPRLEAEDESSFDIDMLSLADIVIKNHTSRKALELHTKKIARQLMKAKLAENLVS